MHKRKNSLFITLALSMVSVLSVAQSIGNLMGKILEQSTKQPLVGVNVTLDNNRFGAVTDTAGAFSINAIPIGSYALTISITGYQTKKVPDVTIALNKTYYAEFEL